MIDELGKPAGSEGRDPIQAQNDGRCTDCGGCCDGTWDVEVGPLDVRRERKLLDHVKMEIAGGFFHITTKGTPCPFLDESKRCSIYRTRPDCCRRVDLGGEECNNSRRRLGLELVDLTVSGSVDHEPR